MTHVASFGWNAPRTGTIYRCCEQSTAVHHAPMKLEGWPLLARALAVVVACAAALAGCSANAPKSGSPAVSAPVAAGTADPPAPAFRLAADVRPTAYRLELTIDPAAKQLTGTVSIDITVGNATRAIWLHAAPEVAITRARA